ncbi:MAG: ComEC/Rec2 family competence protein [Patescibacteria group bacterium]
MSKLRQAFYAGRLSPAKIFLIINILFIAGVFILGFQPHAFLAPPGSGDISFYNGKSLSFSGRVCEEADTDYKSRRLTLCALGKTGGLVLITTDLYPIYDYGDFIKITGTLEAPPEIDGFDYESYLARYDIYSVMYYPQISTITGELSGSQNVYLSLMKFKWRLKDLIDLNLPEPEAGLANALLLGYRRTVMREDLQIFSRVGLSHMIAISGSHITILSAMIINFLLALGVRRRRALLIIFGFLLIYPLITGLAASAVRSAIMGGLAFLAMYYQRSGSLIKALVFSAAAMLIFNPKILRADIGFQLSFMALLGIIYLYPIGEGITKRFLEKRKLKIKTKKFLKTILDTINLTLISQIVILPIALINFKQLSLIAPLANVLVLWTFAPLLAALIGALFLSALIPTLSLFWFFPAYLLLKFIFFVSTLLAASTWAAVNINHFNWYLGAGYYAILILLYRRFRH